MNPTAISFIVRSPQWKQYKVKNLLKVNNKNTITDANDVILVSLVRVAFDGVIPISGTS